MQQQTYEVAKHVGDMTTVGIIVGSLTAWLPPISAALAIVYTCLRAYWEFDDRRRRKSANQDGGGNGRT